MKWYFLSKLIIIILAGLGFFAGLEDFVGLLILIDFAIVPIVYFIYKAFKRRKLAAGEYRVKPEGRRL